MAGLTTRCNGLVRVSHSFHPSRCSKAATTMTADGKGWCKQHNPDLVKARREERSAQWSQEAEARRRLEKRTTDAGLALLAELGVKGRVNWNYGDIQQELVIPFDEARKLVKKIDETDNAILEMLPEPEVV